MEQMELKIPSLEFQKIIEQKECYVRLYGDVLEYKIRFLADEPIDNNDLERGWENVANYVHRFVYKEDITNINMENVTNKKSDAKWLVTVDFRGTSLLIKIYYEKYAEATAMLDKLITWRFKHTFE